jgi:hypothetical protein
VSPGLIIFLIFWLRYMNGRLVRLWPAVYPQAECATLNLRDTCLKLTETYGDMMGNGPFGMEIMCLWLRDFRPRA